MAHHVNTKKLILHLVNNIIIAQIKNDFIIPGYHLIYNFTTNNYINDGSIEFIYCTYIQI